MTEDRTYTKEDLIDLKPQHRTFVGIDSDGCVFDTMEIKQKRCFHAVIISHWHLEAIEEHLRETAEFVNLYSKWRGQNRFLTLIKTFDLLRERPEVIESGVEVPELPALRNFIDSGVPLGNPTLEKTVSETGDEELASLLAWSVAVNEEIARTVKNIPPYKWVIESFEQISANSDTICVSQTPVEALVREWKENDLVKYVYAIAGQELGTKTEHLAMATKGKFEPTNVLMIGDAPGDRRAAKENGALFYPINPAQEDASWERFHKEAYAKFLAGEYAGDYEERVVAEFEALLPEIPPWQE